MDTVTICNLALTAAGIPAITSLEEENNNAKLCKRFFPICRDRVLRDHFWSFATKFTELPRAAKDSPDSEYPVRCYLPGDLCRIVKLNDNSAYRRAGREIFVKNYPVTLVYISKVTDPDLYDSCFVEALQNLLSAELCLAASRDIRMAQYFRTEYEKKLAIARSIDSQENSHVYQKKNSGSSFIAARRGC